MRRLLLGIACLLATVLAVAPAAAAPRLALVVGNASYASRPLATAAADAGLVAQALAQAGYAVTAARDLDGKGLRAAFHAFADTARDAGPDASLLVYLAGLGVQFDGNNYMLPVDAALAHDDDVPLQGADLGDFLHALESAPAKSRVLLYDLARESPLSAADEMPLAPGLALVAPAKDTVVGFAAGPGQVAPPAALPYGPYARALAEALGPPTGAAPLGAGALERVRLRVATLTNGAQLPWSTGTLSSDTTPASALDHLAPGARTPDVAFAAALARDSLDGFAEFLRAVPDGPLAARVRVLLALRREATIWRAVAVADDPRAAWTYMRRYPRGPHRFDARRRLAALKAALEPPPRFDPVTFEVPPPGESELALVAHPREAQRGLPPIPAPPAALLPPADAAYYDDLPMPTPAPRGLLPITSPLPQDGSVEAGRITQTDTDGAEIVSQTSVAPNGASTLTLSDGKGAFLTFATHTEASGTRVTVETGPKGDVKSHITTTRVGDATTIVLADAAGTALMRVVTRDDPAGARVTRVTDGDDVPLAGWRRDAAGVVVASETSGALPRPAPIATAVPAAPPSPTVAVPVVPKSPPNAAPPAPQRALVPVAPTAPVAPPPDVPNVRPIEPATPPPQPVAPKPEVATPPASPAARARPAAAPQAPPVPTPQAPPLPSPAPGLTPPPAAAPPVAPPSTAQAAPPAPAPPPLPTTPPAPAPEPPAPARPAAGPLAPSRPAQVPLPPPRPPEARGAAHRKTIQKPSAAKPSAARPAPASRAKPRGKPAPSRRKAKGSR